MADSTDRTGQLLGNYRILRLLGQGGFADVYLGEHIHLNTQAAIKLLRTHLVDDSIDNFRSEARTVAHLVHPNIVRVLDFGVDGTIPFLVMEYAPNGTLRQHHPRGTQVPIEILIPYVQQISAALQYAHDQKFIHRDIKPENLLLGSKQEVLLSDFGIAVVTQSMRIQLANLGTSDTAGTVSYMAPEQIRGETVPASDQYALAIVIYEWLTGTLPFKGMYMEVVLQQMNAAPPSLREKVPSLAPDVEQVILTALAKDPRNRFTRIESFSRALVQAVQPKPSTPVSKPLNGSLEVSAMEASLNGSLGRIALEFARLTGTKVIVLDMNEQRLDFCKRVMGARYAVKLSDRVEQDLRDVTDGHLPDAVIDATGSSVSMSNAFGYITHGGRLVFVGITTDEVRFRHPVFHKPEGTLLCSRNALSADFARIIALIEDGRIDTGPWITHRSAFEELIDVFPSYTRPETGVIKAVVEVGD